MGSPAASPEPPRAVAAVRGRAKTARPSARGYLFFIDLFFIDLFFIDLRLPARFAAPAGRSDADWVKRGGLPD
jgi:hypothetical protein